MNNITIVRLHEYTTGYINYILIMKLNIHYIAIRIRMYHNDTLQNLTMKMSNKSIYMLRPGLKFDRF